MKFYVVIALLVCNFIVNFSLSFWVENTLPTPFDFELWPFEGPFKLGPLGPASRRLEFVLID